MGSKERFTAVFQEYKKGDMTVVVKDVKHGASIETQWLMQLTAITNHGEERERGSRLSMNPYKGGFSDSGMFVQHPSFC